MAGKKLGSKGKGKKKEKLTEEERKKLADQKALADREKLVARQNLTRAFLKVKKDKEYELIRLNESKILDLWRPHLRKAKIKELLEDYEHVKAAFQKAYDKKNQWIQDLENQIQKNEKDYEEASHSHLYEIDQMIEFYEKRLNEVTQMYTEAKSNLYTVLDFERKKMQNTHSEHMNSFKQKIKNLAESVAKADREAKLEQYGQLVDIRNQGNHELYLYRSQMTEKLNQIWEDLHHKILGYVNTNEDKKKELVELLAKDEEMSKTIHDLYVQRSELVKNIEEIKRKHDLFGQAYELHVSKLKDVRDARREEYNRFQGLRDRTLKNTQSCLNGLILIVHDVMKKLSVSLVQRERVVGLVKRILEGETEMERLDPFLRRFGLHGSGEVSAELTSQIATTSARGKGLQKFTFGVDEVIHRFDCDCSKCNCEDGEDDDRNLRTDAAINAVSKMYGKMDRFWIRYNKVGLERAILSQEREQVLKDNQNLKQCLQYYMAGMNPPSLAPAHPNPRIMEENTKKIREYMRTMLEARERRKCQSKGIRIMK